MANERFSRAWVHRWARSCFKPNCCHAGNVVTGSFVQFWKIMEQQPFRVYQESQRVRVYSEPIGMNEPGANILTTRPLALTDSLTISTRGHIKSRSQTFVRSHTIDWRTINIHTIDDVPSTGCAYINIHLLTLFFITFTFRFVFIFPSKNASTSTWYRSPLLV